MPMGTDSGNKHTEMKILSMIGFGFALFSFEYRCDFTVKEFFQLKFFEELKRWLRDEELILLLLKTQVWFLEPMLSGYNHL